VRGAHRRLDELDSCSCHVAFVVVAGCSFAWIFRTKGIANQLAAARDSSGTELRLERGSDCRCDLPPAHWADLGRRKSCHGRLARRSGRSARGRCTGHSSRNCFDSRNRAIVCSSGLERHQAGVFFAPILTVTDACVSVEASGAREGIKGKSGAKPARSRHCERGFAALNYHSIC